MNTELEAKLTGAYAVQDVNGNFSIGGSSAAYVKPGYSGYGIENGRIAIPDGVTEFILEQEKNVETLKQQAIENARFPMSDGKAPNSAYYQIGKAATKFFNSKYSGSMFLKVK